MQSDVVVAGGSIAGLLCAREVARRGHAVTVMEGGHEVGTPDHCGGLTSTGALDALGVGGRGEYMGNRIEAARISSAGGASFEVPGGGAVEVSRRGLDREAAREAQEAGARIRTSVRVSGMRDGAVRTSAGPVEGCGVLVDATGVASLASRGMRSGIMASAQAEVMAPWIARGRVEVMLDAERYPGFFAWVIPSGEGRGKVGVAGSRIDAVRALRELLGSRGGHSELRLVSAPIWVGGHAAEFASGRTVYAGDAAGQAKPTTGGGILSCGMGGIMAGRAVSAFLESGDAEALASYRGDWEAMFGAEFRSQLAARALLAGLGNASLDALVAAVTPAVAEAAAAGAGFDFHAGAIARALGARGAAGLLRRMPPRDVARLMAAIVGKV